MNKTKTNKLISVLLVLAMLLSLFSGVTFGAINKIAFAENGSNSYTLTVNNGEYEGMSYSIESVTYLDGATDLNSKDGYKSVNVSYDTDVSVGSIVEVSLTHKAFHDNKVDNHAILTFKDDNSNVFGTLFKYDVEYNNETPMDSTVTETIRFVMPNNNVVLRSVGLTQWKVSENDTVFTDLPNEQAYTLDINATGYMIDFCNYIAYGKDIRPMFMGGNYASVINKQRVAEVNMSVDKNIGAFVLAGANHINTICINENDLKGIVIPSTVEKVGEKAFYGIGLYKGIIDFTNATSLIYIDKLSFSGLTYATLVDGVLPKNIVYLGEQAFENSKEITEINIPSSLITIDNLAFNGAVSLCKVDITECSNLKIIGASAFFGTNITSFNFVMAPNLETIGSAAFGLCKFEKLDLSNNNLLTNIDMICSANSLNYAILPNSINSDCIADFCQNCTANSSRYNIIYYEGNFTGEYVGFNCLVVLNDGKMPKNYEYNESCSLNFIPTKQYMCFGGWYDNENCTGEEVTTATAGKTYYAKWLTVDEQKLILKDDETLIPSSSVFNSFIDEQIDKAKTAEELNSIEKVFRNANIETFTDGVVINSDLTLTDEAKTLVNALINECVSDADMEKITDEYTTLNAYTIKVADSNGVTDAKVKIAMKCDNYDETLEYYIAHVSNGSVEYLPAEYEADYLTAETNSFSSFIVVSKAKTVASKPASFTAPLSVDSEDPTITVNGNVATIIDKNLAKIIINGEEVDITGDTMEIDLTSYGNGEHKIVATDKFGKETSETVQVTIEEKPTPTVAPTTKPEVTEKPTVTPEPTQNAKSGALVWIILGVLAIGGVGFAIYKKRK